MQVTTAISTQDVGHACGAFDEPDHRDDGDDQRSDRHHDPRIGEAFPREVEERQDSDDDRELAELHPDIEGRGGQ